MKVGNGFVSNSSTSSFIILRRDGREEILSGRDISPRDFDLLLDKYYLCYSQDDVNQEEFIKVIREQIKDDDNKIETFDDAINYIEDEGLDIPNGLSPFNNLEIPTQLCLFPYLLYKLGKTKEEVLKEMKEEFQTFENFSKQTGFKCQIPCDIN